MTDVCFLNNRWSVAPVISVGASTTASNIYSTAQDDDLLCEFAAEVSAETNNLVCTIDSDSDICSVIGVTESPTMSPSIAASEAPTDEPSMAPVVAPTVTPEAAPTPTPPAADSAYGHTMTLLLVVVVSVALLVV